jgi:RimJ/RimL family protein N-acetyltransferase
MATLRGVRPDEEIVQHLHETIAHWKRHSHGIWTFRDKTSGEFVGRCGLRSQEVAGTPETELGYVVRAERWGKGLATEMARAALDDVFARFEYSSVVAFTLPTNVPSRRVMEKLGFVYERDIVWADLPHVLYRRFQST